MRRLHIDLLYADTHRLTYTHTQVKKKKKKKKESEKKKKTLKAPGGEGRLGHHLRVTLHTAQAHGSHTLWSDHSSLIKFVYIIPVR